jgi:hypothetical protein
VALKRPWIPSPNHSDRGGTGVRLVVVHTAEGAQTGQDLGRYFQNPSAQVSSHVGIDDTPNTAWEYVKRGSSAWTQASANPYSVAVELCAFAEWSPATWDNHPAMLANCAAWIAEECAHFGIPIVKLTASQAQGGGRGVCGHVDLGASGGGHWDPGPGFPFGRVLEMAKGGASTPAPAPVWGAPFIPANLEGIAMFGIIDVANGSRKFVCYDSGLVRRVPGPEWQYLRDELQLPTFQLNDREEGDRYFQYDQALRGQVKERD